MRKIETSEEIEARSRRNRRIGSIFIIALLVLSSLGFAYYGGGSSQEQAAGNPEGNQYGLIEIKNGQDTFYFATYPETFADIPVELNKNYLSYQGQEIFLDIKNDFALQELSLNLGKYAGRMQKACYGHCEEDLPEKGCDNNLVVFRESDTERVYSQDNCVFIQGSIKAVDAFIYNLFNLG